MVLPIYWNNLTLDNNMATPANWSEDAAGTIPIVNFTSDMFMLFTGEGAGAGDSCNNFGSTLTIGGIDTSNAAAFIGLNDTEFHFSGTVNDSNAPGDSGYVVNFTDSDIMSGVIMQFVSSGGSKTYSMGGAISIKALRCNVAVTDAVQIQGIVSVNPIDLSDPPINILSTATLIVGEGELYIYKLDDHPAISGSVGAKLNFLDASGFFIRNCDNVDWIDPDITITKDANATITLDFSIDRGPLDVALPTWVTDIISGDPDPQVVSLGLGFGSATSSDSGIEGYWTGLEALGGMDIRSLTFYNNFSQYAVDTELGWRFSPGSNISLNCGSFVMSGFNYLPTAARVYSSTAFSVALGVDFFTLISGFNVEYGLKFPADVMTGLTFLAPGVVGWDGTAFVRDFSLDGYTDNGDFCFEIGNTAAIRNLTFPTPSRFIGVHGAPASGDFVGSDELTMTGKLTVNGSNFQFSTTPVGDYTINLGIAGSAAAVIEAEVAFIPVADP